MKQFTSVHHLGNLNEAVKQVLQLKRAPLQHQELGKNKTLGLIFLNPSLRTRLSSQKAATNLGMQVMVMNATQESWAWEFEEGAVMNAGKVEHIKDAAAVIGSYCDIVGIRCFPSLTNREEDYNEMVLSQFTNYCSAPVISLESATRHPLQSLADLTTIHENWHSPKKPNVVLTWAPHVKPLPQAVANSFSEWMCRADVNFTIAHPPGYELEETFTQGAAFTHNQDEALRNADFVYVKNWSAYHHYGTMPAAQNSWLLTEEKLQQSNNAKIMHCLPVRRNVELGDALLDGKNSLVQQQAQNRVYAAQSILKTMLETNFTTQPAHEREALHY